jgi:hypothetical protein
MVKGGYGGTFLLDLSPIQFSVKKYDLPTTQVTIYQMPYKTPSPTQPQPTIQFLPELTLSINLLLQEITEDHDIHGKKHSMAIGRCYPMKNRDQDVLPCKFYFLTVSVLMS